MHLTWSFWKINQKKTIKTRDAILETKKLLTIIVPFRNTTDPDREENLDITLRYWVKTGIPNLIVSEHSDAPTKHLDSYANLFESFQVVFTHARGGSWNKAKAINAGVIEANTPYIVILDSDCLTKRKNIDRSLSLLDKGYDVVHPFNRKVTDIIDKTTFKERYDFKTVKSRPQKRRWADGGVVFWNKHSFVVIGMANEYFTGWGGEDNEVMMRADLFDLKRYRIKDTLYHLYHFRPQKTTQKNVEQWQRMEQMNRYSCKQEVNKWPWVTAAKEKFSY
jgi:poly(ribitol-phosphate) beta-N-acetylglucosaminyltransferase